MTAYADVEDAVVGWLIGQLPGVRVVTEVPAQLAGPVVQVARLGGVDPWPTVDDATVDVDAFALTRQAARGLAYTVWHLVRAQLPGVTVAGGVVIRTRTLVAPAWRPWDNTNVRRFGGTYQITVHSQ